MRSEHKDAAEAVPHDFGAIRRDIANLRDDVAGLTRQIGKGVGARLTSRGGRLVTAIGSLIDEQPVWSLVLACAVGFVGSRMLPR